MEQNQATPAALPRQPTRRQRRIRRRLRLVRNWVLFLGACAGAMVLMTTGILWLLPKAHALIAGPEVFEAQQYDGSAYTLDLADGRLALVNANLPLTAEPTPELAVADDATGSSWKRKLLSSTAPWPRLPEQRHCPDAGNRISGRGCPAGCL